MTRRFFAQYLPPEGSTATLDEEARQHARVLRLGHGDVVELFDGHGRQCRAEIARIAPELVCTAGPMIQVEEPRPSIELAVALTKPGKLETVVRMTTELGVGRVHVFEGTRSVARASTQAWPARAERLARVSREAARQSGRATVPTIVEPRTLGAVLADRGASDVAYACVPGDAGPKGELRLPPSMRAWIFVGPEGGFSPGELGTLREAGLIDLCLGPHVLRADTAAIMATGLLAHVRAAGLSAPDPA